jgi:hypothetical protein
MKNFIHRSVRRFYLDGQIYDDSFIPRLKNEYINILNTQMKLQGYAPRIDIDPQFTIDYNGKSYNFKLSVYGTFVGKRNAECIEALDGSKPIFIQKNKSEMSSNDQESQSNQK